MFGRMGWVAAVENSEIILWITTWAFMPAEKRRAMKINIIMEVAPTVFTCRGIGIYSETSAIISGVSATREVRVAKGGAATLQNIQLEKNLRRRFQNRAVGQWGWEDSEKCFPTMITK